MASTYYYTPCLPCCTPPTPCSVPCPNGIASCWQISPLSGIANAYPLGPCTDCANYNTVLGSSSVFCLASVSGGSCAFQATGGAVCNGPGAFFLTYNNSLSRWEFHPDTPDGLPLYTLAKSSFECNGINTFNLASGMGASCTGWPNAITIKPITCGASNCITVGTPCSQCSWPSAYTVTISGIASSSLSGVICPVNPSPSNAITCSALNGTWTLGFSGASNAGWIYKGSNWLCFSDIYGPFFPYFDAFCSNSTYANAYGSTSGPGFVFQIWNMINTEGQVGVGPIVYYCPMSQVQCMSPITLSLVPGMLPPNVNQVLCTGYPGAVTLTPA